MLRIPGSINSKVDRQVTLVQRWNGITPNIKLLLYEFYIHLADMRLMEIIQGVRIKGPINPKKCNAYWRTNKH